MKIKQQTPSLTSKSDEAKHTVQLCTQGEVSHRCYICPVLPDPPTTSLSHALINYYSTIVYNCSFRQIFGIEKSLGSLNEGRFLKEVFWFCIFHQPEIHQTICKNLQHIIVHFSHFIFSRLSLSQKIEFHLIRGLPTPIILITTIFIAIEYRNEAHNASLNAIRVCK